MKAKIQLYLSVILVFVWQTNIWACSSVNNDSHSTVPVDRMLGSNQIEKRIVEHIRKKDEICKFTLLL